MENFRQQIVHCFKGFIHKMVFFIFIFLHFFQVVKSNTLNDIEEYPISYHVDNWNIDYYYGNIPIMDINHFSDNEILLSTYIGLMSFNGEKFTKVESTITGSDSKKIFNVYRTRNGIIWAYNKKGLLKTENNTTKTYALNASKSLFNSLVFDRSENPWIVNSKNLYTIIDDVLTKITNDNNITAVSSGNGDYVLIAKKNKFEKINKQGTILSTFELKDMEANIIRIMEDTLDRIWLITNKGIFIHENGSLKELVEFSGLTSKTSIYIYPGLNNRVYFVLKGHIFVYENNNIYKLNFKLPNGFRIRGLLEDKYENIWLGSWGQGLTRLKKTNLKVFDNTIPNPVVLFNHDNGDKWVSGYSSKTIIKKENGEVLNVEPIKNNKMIEIWDIEQHNDSNVLAAFTKGLVKYNSSGEIIHYYEQFEDKLVSRLLRDSSNTIWAIVDGSVYQLNTTSGNKFIKNAYLKDLEIRSIYEIEDSIIFQTDSQSYTIKQNELAKVSEFDTEIISRHNLYYDKTNNSVWYAANNNKLIHIIDGKQLIYKLQTKLADLLIYDLIVDNGGNILFVSENGVFIIYKKWIQIYDSFRPSSDTRLHYEILLSPLNQKYECNGFDDALTKDEKGRILITCNGGIFIYKHKKIKKSNPPRATINKIHFNSKFKEYSNQNVAYQQPLKSINFIYSSAYLNADLPLEYRHKLHGIDTEWEYTSGAQSSAYISPKPGEYIFEVQVRHTSSDWISNDESKYSFTVLPYFYQTKLFHALALLGLFLIATFFIKYRTRIINKEKNKLAYTVEERTKSLKQLQVRQLERELTQKKNLSNQIKIKTKELKSQMKITLDIERQLQDSQKMELIGHLTSGIAHDFNNILSVVYLGTEIIEDSIKENKIIDKTSSKWLKNIKHASNNGKDIIEQLLLFAKTKPKQLTPENLSNYLRQSLKLIEIAMPESISLELNLNHQDVIIDIDKTKLNQVLLNLILNAKEAINDQGAIQINTSIVNSDKPMCNVCNFPINNTFLRIDIVDNGTGLTTNNSKKLFKLYYTTKTSSGGSGIGLQIVNTYIHEMYGHIIAKNNNTTGATFSIFLPISKDQTYSNPNPNPNPKQNKIILKKPKPNNKSVILLVEDSVVLSKSIKQILEINGHTVDVAFDGESGIEVFNKKPDYYDLIITDNSMPRLTGINMAKQILIINPSIDIIIFTGYQENNLQIEASKIGVKKILQKPFNSSKLLSIISELIDNRENL